MTFCYIHRSVSLSAIIRDGNKQRPITEQCAESRKPWNTQDVFIKFRELCKERAERL